MQQVITIDDKAVMFDVVDGKITTTSVEIAKIFNKEHSNILRDIRSLPQDNFSLFNFEESEYISLRGQKQPSYNLTRDGFSLLAMGFTGKKAYKWKIQFIDAFNKMESYIRNNHIPPRPDTHLLSPMELMELQFQAHKELDYKVEMTNQRLVTLESSSAFTSSDCFAYQKAVGQKVNELITLHNLTRTSRGMLFASIHNGVKAHFRVATYKDLPHFKLQEVLDLVNCANIKAGVGV
jgi:Rha family phage regulatory protein